MRLELALAAVLGLAGCATAPKIPVSHFDTPDPQGETHQLARTVALPLPSGVVQEMTVSLVRPPPRADWTNPVPKVGTSLEFMPRTNSAPLRYIGQSSPNPDGPWQTFTNAILDGPPHLFYFHVPDDGSEKRFFRVVWRPRS